MVRSLALSLLLLPSLRADVTIRYKTTVKSAAILPPEAQDQLKKSGGAPLTMQVKGSRGYTLMGSIASITDLEKQTTTLLNTEQKTFASIGVNDYQKAVADLIPQPSAETQSLLANMETRFETKSTGRKETIQGIVAEERRIVITIVNKTAADQESAGQLMRMVMEIWSAAPAEAARIPAMTEVERFTALSQTAMNPSAMIQQFLGPYQAMAKGYDGLAKELTEQRSLVLRTRVAIFVPALAQNAAALAKVGRQVPEFDPNGPISEITQEVDELSTTPVDSSVFEVPAAYQPAPVSDILKSRFPQLGGK